MVSNVDKKVMYGSMTLEVSCSESWDGGVGGGVGGTMFCMGMFCPKAQPLYPFVFVLSFIRKGTLFTYLLKNNASLFQTLGVRLMNNTMGEHKLLPLEILTQK